MSERTVVVFGAGATKACGGPMTNEILPQAYNPRERRDMENDGYGDVIRREGFADYISKLPS